MDLQLLLPYIKEYGYIAFYLVLWIGFFGFPVPNEVIVMTSGLIANKSVLHPVLTFIVTYLGVISSLTTLYCLGRFGNTLTKTKKKIHSDKLKNAKDMIKKHGAFSLCISYYFPTARHLIPLILGKNNFPFRTFAIYSFTNAFMWTSIYFMIGYEFGVYIDVIGSNVYEYGWYGLGLIILICIVVYIWKSRNVDTKVERNN